MEYPFTHTTPELKINPTKDDIVESLTPFGNLTEYFGAASDHIKTFFGIDDFEPPKTNAEKIKKVTLPTRKKTEESLPPVNTIESPSRSSLDINQPTTGYSLSSQQLSTGKKISEFFMSKGLSKEQSAAIAGNLFAESSFRSGVLGDTGQSYGLAQWNGKRLDSLKRFSAEKRKSLDDVDLQLEFIWKELNTTERNAFNKLIKSSNVKEATKLFSDHYERPAVYNGHHREKMSEEFYSLI